MENFSPTQFELETCLKVAKRAARNWELIEAEDLAQELVLWLLTHPKQVTRFREYAKPEATLVLTLKREAVRICVKETSRATGQKLEVSNEWAK